MRPSEPLLAWMRKMLKDKGLNTAHVADKAGIARSRVRKILSGTEDMTVDELMKLSETLELDPADLTGVPVTAEGEIDVAKLEPATETEGPLVDPWGNQPEQLFQIAFQLGCNFTFLADTSELGDSGVPQHFLDKYDGEIPIQLDAAYHSYNEASYSDTGITLTLSFDALYTCHFPWSCIRRFVLQPAAPEPVQPEPEHAPTPVPHLRLVT